MSFGTNTRLKTFAPLVNCVNKCRGLPIVNKSDVLIMTGFRVRSDLCSNLKIGLIWLYSNQIIIRLV